MDAVLQFSQKLREPWSADTVSASLTHSTIAEIIAKFSDLDSPIKLRLLLSFLTAKKGTMLELRESMEQFIQLCLRDEEEWVRALAELLMNYPSTGSIDCHNVNESFLSEIKEAVEAVKLHENTFYPLEFAYLNTSLVRMYISEPKTIKDVSDASALADKKLSLNDLSSAVHKNLHFTVNPDFHLPEDSLNLLEERRIASESSHAVTTPRPSPPATPRLLAMHSTGTPRTSINRQHSSGPSMFRSNTGPSPLGSPSGSIFERRSSLAAPRTLDRKVSLSAGGIGSQRKGRIQMLDDQEANEVIALTAKTTQDRKLTDSAHALEEDEKERKRRERQEAQERRKFEKERDKEEKQKRKEREKEEKTKLQERVKMEREAAKSMKQQSQTHKRKAEDGHSSDDHASKRQAMPLAPARTAVVFSQSGINMETFPSSTEPHAMPMQWSSASSSQPVSSLLSQVLSQPQVPQMQAGATVSAAVPVPPTTTAIPPSLDSLLGITNCLAQEERALIEAFLTGQKNNPTPDAGPLRHIRLHEEEKTDPSTGTRYLEQIVFEINYGNGQWRKLKRKKKLA